MANSTLNTIQKNIESLFNAAELLASNSYYGPAIHLMMAARKESVKWITLHCWKYLATDTRAQVFRHDFKHKAAGVFPISARRTGNARFCYRCSVIEKIRNPEIEDEVVAEPSGFNRNDYDSIRKDVTVAKYYVDKLSGLEPSKEILYDIFPESRKEIEERLAELANKLDQVPRD
jgi:AbiV family abortive infection protein